MSCRLVVLTEIIAPYRIPVFNAAAEREGIDLHVIFLAETDPTLRQWQVYKEELRFSYEILPSWRRRLGRYNILLNRGVAAALQKAAPDAILCGGYNYVASWQCLRWARRQRVPFLLWVESTANDSRRRHGLVESLKARYLRRCDGFVVPGKSSFEYVRSFGVAEGTIFTAPNAVDVEFFSCRAEAARKESASLRSMLGLPSRFFLFVGRLVPEKGVFDLLQAYGTLAPELRTEMGLVFVGDGVSRSELRRRAAAIRPGQVLIADFTQREQLPSYYSLAEIVVFPTHTDTWGMVVNEAMACALPVIATSVAGCTADLVQDQWNGFVVRSGDIVQLAKTMDRLARDAVLRSRMGEHSRERIAHYTPEACAEGVARAAFACTRHE